MSSLSEHPQPTAYDLRSHGYSIIPIRVDKKPHYALLPKDANGKATWKEYQKRQTSTEEISIWEKANSPAYAIVTGKVSSVVCFDFDGDQGKELAERWGVRPHRKTGSGGLHWDVRHPGRYIPTLNSKAKKQLGERWPGVDVKGDGGYAIALGRSTKGPYQWLREIDPDPAALVPVEVWEFLCATNRADFAERLIVMALGRIPSVGRNGSGFWLAGQLRDNGYSIDDARGAMRSYRLQCPHQNTKGASEEYTVEECEASLAQAYSQPARAPWGQPAPDPTPSGSTPKPQFDPGPHPATTRTAATDDEEKKRGFGFAVSKDAVWYLDLADPDSTKPIYVCSHLQVEALTRDSNSSEWGRLLVWTDLEGNEKVWSMPMELLAADGAELRRELLRGGLILGTHYQANHLLLRYILSEKPQQKALSVPHLGWNGAVYVLPDASIPEDADGEKVIFQGPQYAQHYYATSRTLGEWQEKVSTPCCGNSRLVFGVSIGFTGALLEPLNTEGGGFHVIGTTSLGKSTMQVVAGSVLGGGNGNKGFCRSWRHTGNGLEAVALIHNDSTLILDELREMSDPKEVETCVYMLANGSGKGRMTRTGSGARPTPAWRLLLLSSGEFALSDYAAAAGRKIKGGAEVRLINLPANAGAKYGLFEDIHDELSPKAFAELLKNAALQHYGTAFRVFLERFTADRERWLTQARSTINKFTKDHLTSDSASEVGRALHRFAVVAAAGEIATTMGITCWAPGTAVWAAGLCYDDWIQFRGGTGQADMQAALRQVRAFFEANGSSQFQSLIPQVNIATGDSIEEKIVNRAGYWKHDENGEKLFLVFREAFRDQVCVGFDAQAVAAELANQDLLIRGEGKNLAKKERVPGDKDRFYVIRERIIE